MPTQTLALGRAHQRFPSHLRVLPLVRALTPLHTRCCAYDCAGCGMTQHACVIDGTARRI